MHKDTKTYWLDDPRHVDYVFYGVVLLCAIVVLADLTYHKHVHYIWEKVIGFHGWYGFASCWILVLAAKQLRRLLKRDEDYYD